MLRHDVAVPVSRVPDLIEQGAVALERAVPGVRILPFGHVGDGNMHYNLLQPDGMAADDFRRRARGGPGPGVRPRDRRSAAASAPSTASAASSAPSSARRKSAVELGLMRELKSAARPQGDPEPRCGDLSARALMLDDGETAMTALYAAARRDPLRPRAPGRPRGDRAPAGSRGGERRRRRPHPRGGRQVRGQRARPAERQRRSPARAPRERRRAHPGRLQGGLSQVRRGRLARPAVPRGLGRPGPAVHGRDRGLGDVEQRQSGVLPVPDPDPGGRRAAAAPRQRRAAGTLPAEAGQRRVDRHDVPDRAAGRLRRRRAPDPRAARGRSLPDPRHQDLHHLRRARSHRRTRSTWCSRGPRMRPPAARGSRCS